MKIKTSHFAAICFLMMLLISVMPFTKVSASTVQLWSNSVPYFCPGLYAYSAGYACLATPPFLEGPDDYHGASELTVTVSLAGAANLIGQFGDNNYLGAGMTTTSFDSYWGGFPQAIDYGWSYTVFINDSGGPYVKRARTNPGANLDWSTSLTNPQFMLTNETTLRGIPVAYTTLGGDSNLDNGWAWGGSTEAFSDVQITGGYNTDPTGAITQQWMDFNHQANQQQSTECGVSLWNIPLHSLTISVDSDGSTTPSVGTSYYTFGETVTATHDNGYSFKYWIIDTIDGTTVNLHPSVTLAFAIDVTMEAVFIYSLIPPGDVNGDLRVNLQALFLLANAYGTTPQNPHGTGRHQWNPYADFNNDGSVGLDDLVILATHYYLTV